jgi:Domain of unknown function (DUF4282)
MTSVPPVVPAPARPADNGRFRWGDFFGFRFMITPIVIWAVYLIGVVLITVAAIYAFLATPVSMTGSNGVQTSTASIVEPFLIAIVVFVVGNLVWRVWMELLIVIFRINGSLQEIERRGRGM